MPRAQVRRFYSAVDVVLDTFPFSGGVTSLQALDAGVPVVTVRSGEWRGRLTAVMLEELGLKECCIAEDGDEYVRKARALAEDIDVGTVTKDRLLRALDETRKLFHKRETLREWAILVNRLLQW